MSQDSPFPKHTSKCQEAYIHLLFFLVCAEERKEGRRWAYENIDVNNKP